MAATQIIPRYIVRPTPSDQPASWYYVFDQAEAPARTVAVCSSRTDAEMVRGGLELLSACAVDAGEEAADEVAGVWSGLRPTM